MCVINEKIDVKILVLESLSTNIVLYEEVTGFMIIVTDYIDICISLKIHCKVSLRPFAIVPSGLIV